MKVHKKSGLIAANQPDDTALTQADRFKEAARAADCDEDEARWQDRLKRVVKHKPVPEKPQE